MNNSVFLIDGYGLIYKSYFALIRTPLIGSDGKNKSAIMGFFRTILNIIKETDPSLVIVLMDSKSKTFRSEIYPDYKIQRDKTPDELIDQINEIESLLNLSDVPWLRKNRFEADDLIAAYAKKYSAEGKEVCIYSGDKDFMQLVDSKICMVKTVKGKLQKITEKEVFEDKGVRPDQILDYLSLMGDAADNIPGVKGIGPKTASTLLADYETLDGIYENIDKIKSKAQREKLANDKELAYFSQKLVKLESNIPEIPEISSFNWDLNNLKGVIESLEQMGLKKLGEDYRNFLKVDELEFQNEKTSIVSEKIESLTVLNRDDLEHMAEQLKEASIFAMDTETTSLDPFEAELVGMSFSVKEGSSWYLPLISPDAECLSSEKIKEFFIELFSKNDLKIVGQNWKFDWKILKKWGLDTGAPYFDTMMAAWLIDPLANRYSMDYLADHYLGRKTITYSETVGKGENFSSVVIEKASEYAGEDAEITLCLYNILKKKLEEQKLEDLFYKLEMPLIPVLAQMELNGISLNSEEMKTYGLQLKNKISGVEKQVHSLCGHEFNLKSTKQLQQVLFEERKLTPGKKTKTGYSTDTQVLKDLSSEDVVPALVLKHRTLSKLLSTYVETLPDQVNSISDRIHTHYHQNGTATGRISSNDPNLQNIPVKDDAGRKIRSCFVPEKGYNFISADYSQIELVILAHISGDSVLVNAYKMGKDIHAQTAALIFGIDVSEVIPDQRRIAKTINFGVMYGMSAFRLSRELSIPRKDASQFIENYFREYSGIRDYMNKTVAKAEEDFFVTTLSGRKRPVPRIKSKNKMEKSAEERIAVNTPIQGSAADIMKKSMLAVNKVLIENSMKTRMLLQVHDELILESPEDETEKAMVLVKKAMESVVKLRVPLRVNIEFGNSWGSIH